MAVKTRYIMRAFTAICAFAFSDSLIFSLLDLSTSLQ